MAKQASQWNSVRTGARRNAKSKKNRIYRIARLEMLESRCVLSVNLDLLPSSIAMYSGTTLPLALNAGNAQAQVAFTVSSSNSAGLETILTSGQDRSLRMNVRNYGTMEFQLFDDLTPNTVNRIATLAEQGYFDGMAFHRVIAGFMAQAAGAKWNPQTNQYEAASGTGSNIDDEFNRYLQFTSPGTLAMANAGQAPSQSNSYVGRNNDSGDAQFFITDNPEQNRHLDFHHTIFGLLTSGDSVRQAITNADTNSSDQPTTPIIIDSMRVFSDTDSRVALLHAPTGANGTYVITVTANDGSGMVSKDITVTVASDPTGRNADSYLTTTGPFRMTQGVPYPFQLQGYDLEGNTITYAASSSNASLTIGKEGDAFDPATGKGTLYPSSTLVGVYGVQVGSKTTKANYVYWDTQQIPVFISPAAPSAITLSTHTDAGNWTTDRNNTAGKKLQFHVAGVVPGAEVTVMADGKVIGSAMVPSNASPSGSEIDITTAGDSELQPGAHAITVRQTLKQQAVTVGNWNQGPVDLASSITAPETLTVVDSNPNAPIFVTTHKTTAGVGYQYVYHPATDPDSDITLVSGPTGMVMDTDGTLRWTPTAELAGTRQAVTLSATSRVTDTNPTPITRTESFSIDVVTGPTLEPIGNQTVQQGSTITLQAVGHGTAPLVYSLNNAPDGATIDSQTGKFTWTPTTAQGTGQFMVDIQVVDAYGLNTSASFEIRVFSEHREPHAPTISSIDNMTTEAGQAVDVALAADDFNLPDDKLSFSFDGEAPAGSSLVPGADDTRIVFHWIPLSNQVGNHTIGIKVTDRDGLSATETFDVNVLSHTNNPPSIESTTDQRVDELKPWELKLDVFDADLQSTLIEHLAYNLSTPAAGMTLTEVNGGIVLRWTPSENQGPGVYPVSVTVSDAAGATDTTTFQITVGEVDQPPVLDPLAPQSLQPGHELLVQATARDPDVPTNSIRFSMEGAPDGMTVDPTTGVIRWSVPRDFAFTTGNFLQSYVVTVTATELHPDGSLGLASQQPLSVQVSDPTSILAPGDNGSGGSGGTSGTGGIGGTSRIGGGSAVLSDRVFGTSALNLISPANTAPINLLPNAGALTAAAGSAPAGNYVLGDNGLFGLQLSPVMWSGSNPTPTEQQTPPTDDRSIEEPRLPRKSSQQQAPVRPDELQHASTDAAEDYLDSVTVSKPEATPVRRRNDADATDVAIEELAAAAEEVYLDEQAG